MDVINKLKNNGYLDCLILQHSHLGSQIPDIIEIRKATQEACRFFSEITNQGAPLKYIDLGGGLGVDYTGEQKSVVNSINYSLDEYCINIVETVKYELDQASRSTRPVDLEKQVCQQANQPAKDTTPDDQPAKVFLNHVLHNGLHHLWREFFEATIILM